MKPGDRFTYWFRVPDDEGVFMALPPAQLKCYLVVTRAIQRDKNGGCLSTRQVAQRAQLAPRHAHVALRALVATGLVNRDAKRGETTVYSLPLTWAKGDCSPVGARLRGPENTNDTPTGRQSDPECTPVGKQSDGRRKLDRTPVGKQYCSPVGKQHLESSEKHTHPNDSARLKGARREIASRIPPEPRTDSWPRGGWDSAEDFEAWFARLVWNHPNKNRNAAAKGQALELLRAGILNRSDFEVGYEALRAVAGARWTEQNGRYVQNLAQLLEDRAWKLALSPATPKPAAPVYQTADDYVRKLQAE